MHRYGALFVFRGLKIDEGRLGMKGKDEKGRGEWGFCPPPPLFSFHFHFLLVLKGKT